MTPTITRDNLDAVIDAGKLEVKMTNGNWWAARRNGVTKRFKRDASRIKLPIKFGLKLCGRITEDDFLPSGEINPAHFRHRQ